MKIFLFLVPLFSHLLVIALVIFVYCLSIHPQVLIELNERLGFILAEPWGEYYFAATASILFILEAEYLILKIRNRKKSRFITFERSMGEVSISIHSIEDFIIKISKGFPEIRELKAKVTSNKKRVDITLYIRLLGGHNVSTFADEIGVNIRSQVQNILGLEKKVQVKVNIVEVHENKVEPFQDKMFQGIEIQ